MITQTSLTAGQIDATFREYWNERMLLRASLFLAIYDSVYYRKSSHATSASAKKFNRWAEANAVRNREEARDWIRDASEVTTDSTMGFGYLWGILQMMGHTDWELPKFTEMMERLWVAVDKDPSIGKRIIVIMQGIQKERSGRFAVVDRDQEFLDILGDTSESD